MSLRLTNKRMITSLSDDPSMRGLIAYMNGRRSFRDAGGHGAGGAGDAGGDDTPPDDDAGDSSDEEDDVEDEDAKKDDKKDDKDEEEEVVPKWKYDKAHTRMTAADRRASELEKALNDLKANADVPAELKKELEDIKGQVSKVEGERDKLANLNRTLTIKLASLTMKGLPQWANADTALKLADLSDVDIDEATGKVDNRALKAALNALAKEHPYLVAKDDTKGDGTKNDQDASGTKMAGGRKGQSTNTSRDVLAKRFPVLNR
jgi:hypothetical protein